MPVIGLLHRTVAAGSPSDQGQQRHTRAYEQYVRHLAKSEIFPQHQAGRNNRHQRRSAAACSRLTRHAIASKSDFSGILANMLKLVAGEN